MNTNDNKPPAEQLHDMAFLMQCAVNATLNTMRQWHALDQPMKTYDTRLIDSMLLDTLINASATIAMLRRMEHKLRYPNAFVADEQVPTPAP